MTEKIIRQLPLFSALPPGELQHLVGALQERTYTPGRLLFQEGDLGDRFCILIEGHVEVIKAFGTADERVLSTRGPGEFIGEMSLLEPKGVRSASVRAGTHVHALEMTQVDFDALLARNPSIAIKILRELNARMRKSEDDTIRDLRGKNQELRQAYRELQAAQAQLVEKEKLEHELNMAREIQRSILPTIHPPVGDYIFGACMAPARAVGGDLYDFCALNDGSVGVAIGDVSDKGVPAALFMALFSSLLHVEAQRTRSPAAVLQEVNRHLLERNDSGMFVTAIYGVLDSRSGTYHYARAGHEVPILFDPVGNVQTIGHSQGQPLCLFPDPVLDEGQVQIQPGHTLLLYTDGVTDATNPHDVQFGLDRLLDAIRTIPPSSAQDLCDQMIQVLLDYQGKDRQFDDMTLVAIHRSK